MPSNETAKSKTEAVIRMVQDAKLQTSFLVSRPEVRHNIRNQAAPGSSVREYWEQKQVIGEGAFGSVNLEKCIDIEVLWDDSDYESDGDDGGATNKIGSLRAVKHISKARGQLKLSREFLHELHGLFSFNEPKVCLPTMPFHRRRAGQSMPDNSN